VSRTSETVKGWKIENRDALLPLLLGKLHDQNTILGRKGDEHDKPDLGIEIEHQARHNDADKGAEHAHRDGEQYRDRDDPALVETDEEEIGKENRQAQDDAGLPVGLIFLLGRAGPFVAVAGRQALVGGGSHDGQGGA
jgi:hypothetical protein